MGRFFRPQQKNKRKLLNFCHVGVRPKPLPRAFFDRDTVDVAKNLLGKVLVCRRGPEVVAGAICETEAYTPEDAASHSSRGMSARNATMFGPPGILYVYFIYGMYHCANIVTEAKGRGAAVLLRGVVPLVGIDAMRLRRGGVADRLLVNGPGKLCQAYDFDRAQDGADLCSRSGSIRIKDWGVAVTDVQATPRIGISKAMDVPWRFVARLQLR